MENKKGSGIFLSVIGVATLIVAIIGATFAYFSATASSYNDVNIASTSLSLGFYGDPSRLKTNLIPAHHETAQYSAFDAEWLSAGNKIDGDADGDGQVETDEKITTMGECIDQNSNEICSVYEFTIGNPSETTEMTIEGEIQVVKNEFANLYYAIYDENDQMVVEPTKFLTENDAPAKIPALKQTLKPNANVKNGEKTFDEEDPSTYAPLVDLTSSNYTSQEGYLESEFGKHDGNPTLINGVNNVRSYKMLIWIKETKGDQTEADSGKIFSAGIKFSTGGQGVTGMIAVAKATPAA